MRNILLPTLVALLGCSVDLRGTGETDERLVDPSISAHVPSAPDVIVRPSEVDACETEGSCDAGTSDCSSSEDPGCGCEQGPDSDGDGFADCIDYCPRDALKQEPGACGCGVRDRDADRDGLPDCLDGCPQDAKKSMPGQCGCGKFERDDDGDGVADCVDACPTDREKREPGICGCGKSDLDEDADSVPNCKDACPADPLKVAPGGCGCGSLDEDSDGDGLVDCKDPCVSVTGCSCAAGECSSAPPVVAFVLPRSTKTRAGQLAVEAEASDSDGKIAQVALYVDGKFLRAESMAPYEWGAANSRFEAELEALSVGMHRLELEAVDDSGATARAVLDVELVP